MDRETPMPPGSATPSSRAAMLTVSPKTATGRFIRKHESSQRKNRPSFRLLGRPSMNCRRRSKPALKATLLLRQMRRGLSKLNNASRLSRVPPRHMTHLGADLSADDCVVRNLLPSHIHLLSIHWLKRITPRARSSTRRWRSATMFWLACMRTTCCSTFNCSRITSNARR